jgi:hypothetical protein
MFGAIRLFLPMTFAHSIYDWYYFEARIHFSLHNEDFSSDDSSSTKDW